MNWLCLPIFKISVLRAADIRCIGIGRTALTVSEFAKVKELAVQAQTPPRLVRGSRWKSHPVIFSSGHFAVFIFTIRAKLSLSEGTSQGPNYTQKYFKNEYLVFTTAVCINIYIFYPSAFFVFFRPRIFSRALGSGARREPARTPRRKFGLWPRAMACAAGVQSCTYPRGGIPST